MSDQQLGGHVREAAPAGLAREHELQSAGAQQVELSQLWIELELTKPYGCSRQACSQAAMVYIMQIMKRPQVLLPGPTLAGFSCQLRVAASSLGL